MTTIKRTYVSTTQPQVQSGLWLKPVEGGYAMYFIEGNVVQPVNLVGNAEEKNNDDIAKELIGSVQDKKSANTINGAKAYAKNVKETITGTKKDTASDLTLYGLKAYIDDKFNGKK